MSAISTNRSANVESDGARYEGNRVGVGPHHHRRGCLNHLIPLKISNEAIFNNYSDGHSSAHVDPSTISKEVDLESGELKANNDGKQCRICQADPCDDDGNGDTSEVMELGCDCKGDLGVAHKKCAMTWFLTKGNLHCEICGVMVHNVLDVMEYDPERDSNVNVAIEQIASEVNLEDVEVELALELSLSAVFSEVESESSLNRYRLVNIILASLVMAFFLTWLFYLHYLSELR